MSSVLKGMKPRVAGNIEPNESYKSENTTVQKKQKQNSKFKNQQEQIKVSNKIKTEINALKIITKTKFDYELIELLIDSYNRNELSTTQRRKFNALTEEE